MQILIPVLICLAIAAVCAVILTLASVFFGVKEDEKFLAIRSERSSMGDLFEE